MLCCLMHSIVENREKEQPIVSEQRAPTIYSNFWLYKIDRAWRSLDDAERDAQREELTTTIKQAECVTLRGAYSTVGLRHDTDLMLWVHTEDLDAMQQLAVAIRQTRLGRYMDVSHSWLGLSLGSRYTSDHAPAFVKGVEPGRYLSVYPFIKTHEWYQLSFEERRSAMAEHGLMGREYPEILTNTTSSCGIADHEFVVALETDDLGQMVRMVEHLRSAASRPYTEIDRPIILGVRKPVPEALADLG